MQWDGFCPLGLHTCMDESRRPWQERAQQRTKDSCQLYNPAISDGFITHEDSGLLMQVIVVLRLPADLWWDLGLDYPDMSHLTQFIRSELFTHYHP